MLADFRSILDGRCHIYHGSESETARFFIFGREAENITF